MTDSTPDTTGLPPVLRSTALFATDRPTDLADQIAEHLGRRTPADPVPGGYRVHFPFGLAFLSSAADGLHLEAKAADEDALARVENLVGDQLERFAADDHRIVEWQRR